MGGAARFRGSLGTQVVKIFDLVVARTGLRDHEATSIGLDPVTVHSSPYDHKAYYPTAYPITFRVTGDATTGHLLGAQLVGWLGTEVAKRVDTYATALFHRMTVAEISDLDLSYTHPSGHPGTPCRSPPRPGRPTSGSNGPSRHPRSLTGVRAPPPNRRSTS